jgi:phosphoribosyl-ATP pyrophosphohydrolase
MNVYEELYDTILSRRSDNAEGSYTKYLFDKGLDKILKKVGEECSETIIAAKNSEHGADNTELKNEIADLLYHLFVLCAERDLPLTEVEDVLAERAKKTGNLKQMKTVDKNT